MHCFIQKEINNDKFPKLTQGVNYLKEDEQGIIKSIGMMRKTGTPDETIMELVQEEYNLSREAVLGYM